MNQTSKNQKQLSQDFTNSINRLGQITSIIALVAMFLVPFGTAYALGISLDIKQGILASTSLLAIFIPMCIAENISYYPILGAGGMYLSSITGNVMNMKLPVVVAGQKIVKADPGTDKGDVIAIICVGVSSIVTIVILFLGMFFVGQWLVPILNSPTLKPGFDHITPALLGAITIPQLLSNKSLAIAPVVLGISVYLILGPDRYPTYQSYVLLAIMALSVLSAYIQYKRHNKD